MKYLLIPIITAALLSGCSPGEPQSTDPDSSSVAALAEPEDAGGGSAAVEQDSAAPVASTEAEGAAASEGVPTEGQEGFPMPEEQRRALALQFFDDLAPRILAAALANDVSKRATLVSELRAGLQKLWEHSEPRFVSAVQAEVWRRTFDTPQKAHAVEAYLSTVPLVAAPTGPLVQAPPVAPAPPPRTPAAPVSR